MNDQKINIPGIANLFIICLSIGLFTNSTRAGSLAAEYDFGVSTPGDNLNSRYDSEIYTGVLLEYSYNEYLGWFTSLGFTKFNRPNYPIDTDLAFYRLTLDGVLSYPIITDLRASLFGGMGLYLWQADHAWWVDGRSKDSGDVGYNYGFSIDYSFYKSWSIISRLTNHSVRLEDSSSYFRWTDSIIGLRFEF